MAAMTKSVWHWREVIGFLLIMVAVFALAACSSRVESTSIAPSTPTVEIAEVMATPGYTIPELMPKAGLPVLQAREGFHVSYAPNMPDPVTRSEQAIVEVHFEVVEGVSAVDANTGLEFDTWGYRLAGSDHVSSGVPGPAIRLRVGDVFRFKITNLEGNKHPHNVDFHAVTGQGGGAKDTTVNPGQTAVIEARMLYPGSFMYHCAFGDVPAHIARGMYGGIIVDPATPLPLVDHEWYVVQSEYYLTEDEGLADLDRQALTDEHPTQVVFNGAVGALAGDNSLRMKVGERARIYFINAGLNLTSGFHPIGSHWDRVYQEAATASEPIYGSQTTVVPPGGGTVVEMVGQVPMTAILVDHALTRTFDKGALGMIKIEGADNHEIFEIIEAPMKSEERMHDDEGTAGAMVVEILQGSGVQDDNPDNDYSPFEITVPVGTTVRWVNNDSMMPHTVTADDGSFDSGFLFSGDSWEYVFNTPGEFPYHCFPHPWMKGRVVVSE